MSQNPFMQLYVGDYLADTLDLTTEQHGAYLLLLMTMWRHDAKLPNDNAKLARIARVSARRWHLVWSEIQHFFYVDGGEIRNKRLDREHQKASSISEKRSASGAAGGRAKALKDKKARLAKATDLPQHSQKPEARVDKSDDLSNIPTSSGDADAPPPDPAKVMFDSGRRLLMAAGKSKDQAGRLLGKWRGDHGAEAVIVALGRAQREGAIDPVSFIEGCLRFSEKTKKPYKTDAKGRPEIGSVMVNPKGETIRYVNHFDGWMREYA